MAPVVGTVVVAVVAAVVTVIIGNGLSTLHDCTASIVVAVVFYLGCDCWWYCSGVVC